MKQSRRNFIKSAFAAAAIIVIPAPLQQFHSQKYYTMTANGACNYDDEFWRDIIMKAAQRLADKIDEDIAQMIIHGELPS